MIRDECRLRIAVFLSEYLDATSGSILLQSDAELTDGIEMLIDHEIFSKSELKKECMKKYSTFIPDRLFGKYADRKEKSHDR